MIRKLALFIALTLLPQLSHATLVDRIAAIVNTQVITLFDVDKAMVAQVGRIQSIEDPRQRKMIFKKMQSQALEMLVEESLLEEEMRNKKITVTDQDIDNAVKSISSSNKMTLAQFSRELKRKGRSLASFRKNLRSQLKKVKFVREALAGAAVVTDADIDEFIKDNSDRLGGSSQVVISQMILKLDRTSSALEQQRAKAIVDKVKLEASSLSKFKSLAKKYSDEKSLSKTQTYKSSELQKSIQEALNGQKEGSVSRPILTQHGVLLVYLVERKSELVGIDKNLIRDQVRDKVYEWKVQKALKAYVVKLKQRSYVDVKI